VVAVDDHVDSFSDPGDAHDDEQLAKEDSLGSMLRFLKKYFSKKGKKIGGFDFKSCKKNDHNIGC
jgi:hypothetical protein